MRQAEIGPNGAGQNATQRGLGRQLGHPEGLAGRLVGELMRLANRRPIRRAVEALEVGPHDFVLDLGCGTGEALRLIAARAPGGIAHGLDGSALMIARAAKTNRDAVRSGRVRLHHGRFESLPYPDGAFDKLLAANVMYFWHQPDAVLGEICRVLRPGGSFVAYVTDEASLRRWRFATPATHRLYDAASLATELGRGGLSQVEVAELPLPAGTKGLIARAVRP